METHLGQRGTGWGRDSRTMHIPFTAATLGTSQRKGVSRLHPIDGTALEWPPGGSLEQQSLLGNVQEREHRGEESTPVFRDLRGLEKDNRFTALHQCGQTHKRSHQDYSQKQKLDKTYQY